MGIGGVRTVYNIEGCGANVLRWVIWGYFRGLGDVGQCMELANGRLVYGVAICRANV